MQGNMWFASTMVANLASKSYNSEFSSLDSYYIAIARCYAVIIGGSFISRLSDFKILLVE
jgi:hypothetical protein